jgi:GNAT superfamily N-acetyltransferase
MPAPSTDWTVRELSHDDDDFIPALSLAITSCTGDSQSVAPTVRDLLQNESVGGLRLRPIIAAYAQNILHLAVVAVESPGASNLFVLPFDLASTLSHEAGVLAVELALKRSQDYGVSLSQVVGPHGESNWDAILEQSGFTRLTNLIYMARSIHIENARVLEPCGHNGRWVTYSAEAEPLFCEAIERSYVQSMDCPEIANMRTARQSLLSHRAVGNFDPAKWFVLSEGDRPQGVLLLNRVCNEPLIEIVYMGVSQVARGRGVGDALMRKALRVAEANSMRLILAVDARNEPAKRFYVRWRFAEIERRAAWIASACGIGR